MMAGDHIAKRWAVVKDPLVRGGGVADGSLEADVIDVCSHADGRESVSQL